MIFVDTGGWLACINNKDKDHQIAIKYYIQLRQKNIPLITSNYIVDETLTWLNYNNCHQKAIKVMELWQEAEKNGLLNINWVDKGIAEESWKIFKKFSDHKLSFTDCTSFVICRNYEIKKVFSFDQDFNILGFLLSPYQIHENKVSYDVLRPISN